MINGFKVITLCGSTRFKDEFLEAQKRLTLEGNIVISVGLFGHSGDDVVWTEGVKDMLDRQHLAKIDLADEIFVINVGGYIGDSTRREIAYAEFKGKSIAYLEECKKSSIYANYTALGELHDSGKLSDEDWKRAEHWFDDNRNAAIAEYNVCQGPWPYQWKNNDAVVCGILQQMGVVSIDYSDLKDLYDADYVYEVRIKGKGANNEEQLQSIIDTIRSEYLIQLRSSKKVVVTLCGSSNPSGLLEKLADCMDGLNIVWQIRKLPKESKVIEASIIFCMTIIEMLEKWADETINLYNPIAQTVQLGYYTQSVLSRIKRSPDLLILGINPGSGGGSVRQSGTELLDGNPCFKGKSDEEIIFDLFKRYDPQTRRHGWDLLNKIKKMLGFAGKQTLNDLDKFVLSNMVFFGTEHQGDIPKEINQEVCAKKTLELIDILKPKVVLLIGDQSRYLFEKVSKSTFIGLVAPNYHTFYSFYKESHIISIYHTAYFKFYSDKNMKIIGNILGYALDNPLKRVDQYKLEAYLKETATSYDFYINDGQKGKRDEVQERIRELKKMVLKNCEYQSIYNRTVLYHEFHTVIRNGKYVSSKDTIAIDLLFEDNDCVIRFCTRRYDPEKTKEIAIAIDGVYTPGNTNLTAPHWHVHAKMPQSTSNVEIARNMNNFLGKVKAYRDKEFPLKS